MKIKEDYHFARSRKISAVGLQEKYEASDREALVNYDWPNMHKKAQPKNDKRNIESRSVKTSAFKDKYSWVGHFVKQKRPEKAC